MGEDTMSSGWVLKLVLAVFWLGVLVGCQEAEEFELEGLEMPPIEEELTELPLGDYHIPIPLVEEVTSGGIKRRHRMQLDFLLHVLVKSSERSEVEKAWERHEGTIRDQVIRVCRKATLQELQEPDLATLKARLMQALAGPTGQKDLRHLLITEVVSQPL